MHIYLWQWIAYWFNRTDVYSNQGACKMYVPCNTISVSHQDNDSIIDFMFGEMA